MNRWFKYALISLLLACLAACSTSLFKPATVTFTSAEFQTALAKKFPIQKQYMGLLDVTISHPLVSMRPEIKHIALEFDADVAAFGAKQPYKSKLNITTSLAYNAATRSIVLQDPQLDNIDIEGMTNGRIKGLNQMAAVWISESLQGTSIYTFNPDDLHFIGMKLEPESIEITEQGVVVHIAK